VDVCGRAYRTTPTGNLAHHFHATPTADLEESFNVAPTEDVAAVRFDPKAEQRELFAARWGLLPPWVKDDGKRPPMLMNAKAETVADKPAFRTPFRRRRCLVVFDGFYEWLKDGKEKRPHVIRLKSRAPMALAGLWDHNRAFDMDSAVVLTTDANDVVRGIHDRMPVILEGEEAWQRWLDPETDEETLKSLLHPCDPSLLEVFEVSQHVNSVKNKDPVCLEPISKRTSFIEGEDERG
jgi:putative SOS response-associated peptidase YedK